MSKRILFCLSLVFFCFSVKAQKEQNEVPLQELLKLLELHYDVSFTYVDHNLEGLSLAPPSTNDKLSTVLEYLEEKTGLLFQPLDDRFIAIRKAQSPKITISGILKENATDAVIVGATVQTGDQFVVSNKKGYFQLKDIPVTDSISIQVLGYKKRFLPAKNFQGKQSQIIYLQPHILTLPEVIISNYITEGIDKRADGSFVIDTEVLGILPGLSEPDVLHAIQSIPGIQSINETVSYINVRGGTNDQNLILWNDIKMYQSGHFFGLISAFNPYLIDNVRLIKNGTSSAFGDGVSSTIDIHTDDKLAPKLSGGAGMNLISGDFFLKVPLSRKATIQLSGRRSISDLIKTPTYNRYFERAFRNTEIETASVGTKNISTDKDFHLYDLSMKYIHHISDKEKLRINFLNIYNDIEYQESALPGLVTEVKTSGLKQYTAASGISYDRLWNNKVKTTGSVYFSSYELSAVNFDILNNQRLIQKNEVLDIGVSFDSRIALTNSIDLFSGYQFFEVGIGNLEDVNRPKFRRLTKEVMRTHAGFTELNYTSKSEKTNLRLGVRANYFKKLDELRIEPRIAFNQKLQKNLSVEVLGEFKSQTTAQIIDLQNDFLGVEKRRWVLSNNNDIPLIKSKQLSVGLHYDRANFLISLEGYYKDVDGITSSSQGFQNQFQYIRASGKYETTGIDFLINKKFKNLNFWGSYSLAENQFEFPRFEPSIFPNNLDIRHTGAIGSSYKYGNIQLSLGLSWRTGKPFTEPVWEEAVVDNTIVYQKPNSSRLQNYLRIDISGKYNFQISKRLRGQLGASVWNLFNKENIVNRYFLLNNDDQIKRMHLNALGFTPNFTFRAFFDPHG